MAPPPVEPPPVEPAPVRTLIFSDLPFSGLDYQNERVENIGCADDLSSCTGTFRGTSLTFATEPTAGGGDGPHYTILGPWAHISPPVVFTVTAEGLQGRMAAVVGPTFANSLPVALGAATWQGEMVALDSANRVVRGGATLTIADLAAPAVDVRLTPDGRTAMTWDALPVTGGRFQADTSATDYLKGAFYGPAAQEAGGVFERNQLLGAFGARR